MKQYKYALFDWDGTIVKSLDVWLYCLKKQLDDHGYNFNDKDIGANYELFRQHAQSLGVTNVDKIIDLASKNVTQQMHGVDPCDGAKELLITLKVFGIKVALVTTSTHAQVDPLLAKFYLDDKFDAIVCGDDVKQQKPNPESASMALKLLDGNPEHAVMIGDSATDIIFSRNSALDSILFHPRRYSVFYNLTELKELQPTYIVNDLRDVSNLINPII